MNKTNTLLLICVALLFASCSQVYSPAMYHQDIAYQPKPASFDTVKAATYASVGFHGSLSNQYNDFLPSAQFNLSRGYVFNGFNVAYGAFGAVGSYEHGNQTVTTTRIDNFDDKFFGAVGGRVSINAFVNDELRDFRFIGIEAAYSHEFGDYADLRKEMNRLTGYFVDPRTDLFTIGLTTEVVFKDKRKSGGIEHGIRGFLGTTLGNNPLDKTFYAKGSGNDNAFRTVFPKASYFIRFKNYFGTAEFGSEFALRFGVAF